MIPYGHSIRLVQRVVTDAAPMPKLMWFCEIYTECTCPNCDEEAHWVWDEYEPHETASGARAYVRSRYSWAGE